MPIPDEILKIERPKNTRVKTGPKGTYYVIARTCEYKNGRNIPKELGVVGKIIDGKYVANPNTKDEGIDIKKYGTIALFHKSGCSIYEDLLKEINFEEARKIYSIALLRACEPEVRNRDIQNEYALKNGLAIYRQYADKQIQAVLDGNYDWSIFEKEKYTAGLSYGKLIGTTVLLKAFSKLKASFVA